MSEIKRINYQNSEPNQLINEKKRKYLFENPL